jgi:hypothetical protein
MHFGRRKGTAVVSNSGCFVLTSSSLLAFRSGTTQSVGERLCADIELANFGSSDLAKTEVNWSLIGEQGGLLSGGVLCSCHHSPRGVHSLATLSLSIPELATAQKLTLRLTLDDPKRGNAWDIWAFPKAVDLEPRDVLVTRAWDESCQKALLSGGKVLLLTSGSAAVALGFSSVFWNTSWTGRQAPHTLGMVVNAEHPVFSAFPTENHSNWQWWELVQPIDTWFRSHKLGLLFECRVGRGRLMVCSMDLTADLQHRLVARQLYHSVLSYMQSQRFSPGCNLSLEEIGALLAAQETRE